jgi:hypothetical protein
MSLTPTRRRTLQWMFAGLAAVPALPQLAMAADGVTGALDPKIAWPNLELPVNASLGYGTDPNLMEPSVPWTLILSAQQKAVLNLIGDIVLPREGDDPGAGELMIADFVDEWISSPYEGQAWDRGLILNLLAWLDLHGRALSGKDFLDAGKPTQDLVVAELMRDPVPQHLFQASSAFQRLRGLIVGGYCTTPEGKAAIGYLGNTPVIGEWPGPTDEAMAHLRALLKDLKLPVTV